MSRRVKNQQSNSVDIKPKQNKRNTGSSFDLANNSSAYGLSDFKERQFLSGS